MLMPAGAGEAKQELVKKGRDTTKYMDQQRRDEMAGRSAGRLSIVAIGAHMDDTWMGMGGAALRAAREGHQVTMVQAVSQYGAWPAVSGREAEIKPIVQKVADDAGVRLITLGYDYMRLENGVALVDQLSRLLGELRPDLVFCPVEDDSNQDHVALGTASRVAAMHGSCFLSPDSDYRAPREIMRFRLGWQTNNFAPDTYLDISDVFLDLIEILNTFDMIYSRRTGWPLYTASVTDHAMGDRTVGLSDHTIHKFATCVDDGKRCGARYAEGYMSYKRSASQTSLLIGL
jgi:LmbE family N-acetylglucosaminyl deacetylase